MVSESDVKAFLCSLVESKATGPDEIPARLIKICSQVIAPSLSALFHISLVSGVVPLDWKLANVVQVFKKGDVNNVVNYRPVSLLTSISKVLERIVFAQVVSFVKDSLYDLQHGSEPIGRVLLDCYKFFMTLVLL